MTSFLCKLGPKNNFHIMHKVYIYKQEVVVIQEWKLKAKLARNTIFEGNYDKTLSHIPGNNVASAFLGD